MSTDLDAQIAEIRRRYPRRVIRTYSTDTYFDGSIGPVHRVTEYDETGTQMVEELLQKERKRLDRRNSVVNAIFDGGQDD